MSNTIGGPRPLPPAALPGAKSPELLWSSEAVLALDTLDRYVRNDVRQFQPDPARATVVDAAKGTYRTPIEGTRVTVLWTLDAQRNEATVTSLEVKKRGWFG